MRTGGRVDGPTFGRFAALLGEGLGIMAGFELHMDTDNAAFENDREAEVARILRWTADRLEHGVVSVGRCIDANGNTVGSFRFVEGGE